MIMPIIITITLIAAVILFVIGMQIYSDKKLAQSDDSILTRMEQLIVDLNKMNTPTETGTQLKTQIESPASESLKKQPVDPDFNPHPYSAKFERLSDSEIEDVKEYLTTKQRKSIGG